MGERYVLVLFCMQKPILIGFLALAAEEEVLRHPDEEELIIEAPTWSHKFVVTPNAFSWSDMDEYQEDCEIEVLGDTLWRGNSTIVSDGDWRRLETVLRLLPGPVTNNSSGSTVPTQPRGSLRSQLLQEHPWLADVWAKGHHSREEELIPGTEAMDSGGKDVHDTVEDTGSSSDDDFSEKTGSVDADEVLDAIEAKKCEMRNTGHGSQGPFAWRMMSAAAASSSGEACPTSFRGDARSPDARKFTSTYSLQSSASFVSNLYTGELAQILAEYWVAKMSYFYEIWMASTQEHHEFSERRPSPFVNLKLSSMLFAVPRTECCLECSG